MARELITSLVAVVVCALALLAAQRVLQRAAMREVLQEFNARVLRADRDIEETFDRAYRMLRMRRVIARTGSGYLILPRGRALVTYYANSIVHLLGPFAEGIRARDALPAHDWERATVPAHP